MGAHPTLKQRLITGSVGLFVAALVLVSGASGSPGPATGTVHKAPYSGSTWNNYTTTTSGGCSSPRLYKAPSWSGTTGKGSFAIGDVSPYCSNTTLGAHNLAITREVMGVVIPFNATTGNHTVRAHLMLSFHSTWSLYPPTRCPNHGQYFVCSVGASWNLLAGGYLFDATSNTSVAVLQSSPPVYPWPVNLSNGSYWDSACSSSGCQSSSSASSSGGANLVLHLVWTGTGKFVSGHLYQLGVELNLWMESSAYYSNTKMRGGSAHVGGQVQFALGSFVVS